MANIYALTKEYDDLFNTLIESADEETGEVNEAVSKALDIKKEEVEEKAVAVACVVKRLQATAAEIDAEIERLSAYKKRCERSEKWLRDGLGNALTVCGYERLESIKANITFRISKETIIDNIDEVPDEYKKAKTTYSTNKAAIKAAIESGTIVPGARLQVNKNIQIK